MITHFQNAIPSVNETQMQMKSWGLKKENVKPNLIKANDDICCK